MLGLQMRVDELQSLGAKTLPAGIFGGLRGDVIEALPGQ